MASFKEFVPGGGAIKEFVPGSGQLGSKQSSNNDLSVIPLERAHSDLKVTTKEWVPGAANEASSQDVYGNDYPSDVPVDNVEDYSLDWGDGATNLPAPPRRSLQTIGLPEPIRQHFASLDLEALRQMEPNDERYKELPSRFHSAYSLDDTYAQSQRGTGGSYGYPSGVYKVIDRSDSQMYALRRVDNVRITPTTSAIAKTVMGKWCEIRHPSICSLYSISAERAGVFFLHAYHPAAQTLRERFIDQRSGGMLPENLLWRIFVHLLSGIRLVHVRGIPIRNISVSHILMTSGIIARFNGVGIVDVLESDSRKTVPDLLVEDIMKLGYVMLSLATRSFATPKNVDQALQAMSRQYSQSFHQVIATLLQGKANAEQISQMVTERIHDELDQSMAGSDALQSHLRSEYENGRLVKLMMKLNFVTERPDFANNAQWSETGDRYVLKLFRDYVYHQNSAEGTPVLDGGHVISALNKLDVGDPEKILLSSRDGKDLLVVSFTDVRRCLEEAIEEMANSSDVSRMQRQGNDQRNGHGGMYMPPQQSQYYMQQQDGRSPRGARPVYNGGGVQMQQIPPQMTHREERHHTNHRMRQSDGQYQQQTHNAGGSGYPDWSYNT